MNETKMDKSRTEALIGKENLDKLAKKMITVVGVGGVGGACATMLARAGVEKIRIVDFDLVTSSNVNRQVIAFADTIGQKKVEVLSSMLKRINPNIFVDAICERLTQENVERIVKDSDVVVDAIDSVKDKLELILYCKRNNIYIVSAMGAGNRFDVPNFYLTDIYKTHDDGLAKVLRKKLREENIKELDVVTSSSKPQKVEGVIGSISYYPVASATVLCAAIINKIIKEEIWE